MQPRPRHSRTLAGRRSGMECSGMERSGTGRDGCPPGGRVRWSRRGDGSRQPSGGSRCRRGRRRSAAAR